MRGRWAALWCWPLVGAVATGPPQPASGAAADAPIVHALGRSGRSYRVLVPPDAGEAKHPALVLYLHPSGGLKLDRVRRKYWPLFRDRKCTMVLPESKAEGYWSGGDADYLADVLTDAQTRYGVQAGNVILLGVAGGGQAAMFLVDREPETFRAVILISANPVTVRGNESVWFYPSRKTLKRCPYFVVNSLRQGAALMYWRQVRARLAPAGAKISILPTLGEPGPDLPAPPALRRWLEQVLAGGHLVPLADPQKAAVAKMFQPCASVLPKAIETGRPAAVAGRIVKDGPTFRLAMGLPAGFERSMAEDARDAGGRPITQIRAEHKQWPIYVRCDARAADVPMDKALAEEELETIQRGMLYQLYHTGLVKQAGRRWRLRIGSITYPDRRRGWVSTLFLHAAVPIGADPRQWLEVLVRDETQQPEAGELAAVFLAVIGSLTVEPAPATQPAAPTRPAAGK